MREIDFLPPWYPQIQQNNRRLIRQAWASFAILLLLSGYAAFKRSEVRCGKIVTAQCQAQITISRKQLIQLTEKLKYESALRRQDQIVARLGIGVDSTRLLKSLEDAMTPQMLLTSISLETIEQPKTAAEISITASDPSSASPKSDPSERDRRLKVVVNGVAPSDTQVACLMENLAKVSCFENLAFPYVRQAASRDGHAMREFEVSFDLNLNPPADGLTSEDRP